MDSNKALNETQVWTPQFSFRMCRCGSRHSRALIQGQSLGIMQWSGWASSACCVFTSAPDSATMPGSPLNPERASFSLCMQRTNKLWKSQWVRVRSLALEFDNIFFCLLAEQEPLWERNEVTRTSTAPSLHYQPQCWEDSHVPCVPRESGPSLGTC